MEGAFRGPLPPDLRLIETLGWRPDAGFAYLDRHLARLAATAAAFGAPFDRTAVVRALHAAVDLVDRAPTLRVRLTLGLAGDARAAAAPFAPGPSVWTARIASDRLTAADPWLRVKTTNRPRYDAARAAMPPDLDELLFLNERDELCEGAITNVFVRSDAVLLTPPLSCGLLPGVLRAELLARGAAREAVLRPSDLVGGGLHLGNALRGLIPARLA